MIQREVLQSGVTSAINTIRAFSVDSNPLVERLGITLVESLLSRQSAIGNRQSSFVTHAAKCRMPIG